VVLLLEVLGGISPEIGAGLQFSPYDFTVEEITTDGTVLQTNSEYDFSSKYEGSDPKTLKFTHFVLQKRNWNTTDALGAIGKRLGVPQTRFNFAGTKDRASISTQLASVFGVNPQRVEGVLLKDISINGAWLAPDKVRLGSLKGNRFKIKLTQSNCSQVAKSSKLLEAAGGLDFCMPNYFGVQRFGSLRSNSARMGLLMLRGDFQTAVMEYLTLTTDNESSESAGARKRLQDEGDFPKALEYFPRKLGFERKMIGKLAANPTDFVGALRSLPRTLNLLFLHAFQAALFNQTLRARIESGLLHTPQEGDLLVPIGNDGFPLVHQAAPASELSLAQKEIEGKKALIASRLVGGRGIPLTQIEQETLQPLGLSAESFRVKGMPELDCGSAVRCLSVPLAGFKAEELQGPDGALVQFSLPSGSYATVAVASLLGWHSRQ
jgi:tRNA pseudouridine13 synthase